MSRRRLDWVVVVALLALGVLGVGASSVFGLTLEPTVHPLPGSNFQGGDGNQANQTVDGHHYFDWQHLENQGAVDHQSDLGPSPNSLGPGSSTPDDHFTEGSKEGTPADWVLNVGNLGAGGADILDLYRSLDRGAGDQAFLYLAMTRLEATGSWFLTYELNQEAPRRSQTATSQEGAQNQVGPVTRQLPIPCRKTGDLLITFEETGNETTVHVQEWITTPADNLDDHGCARAGRLEDVNGADGLTHEMVQGAFNPPNRGSIHNYLPGCGRRLPSGEGCFATGQNIPEGHFVEAAINLSKVLQIEEGPDNCSDKSFVSIWAHSRAELSYTSDMKDYVAPRPFVISVCKASPDLSTTQGAVIGGEKKVPVTSVPVGTPIFDTARLTGGKAPTGTITFRLYGPGNTTCTGRPLFRSRRSVGEANGPYYSGSFTPTRTGTYRWTAEYSGDANNHPAERTGCNEEPVKVTKLQPEITTEASGTIVLGGAIHDTATLTGGHSPTGTITFKLFGPDDAGCASPVHTFAPVTVKGEGIYRSPAPDFVPNAAGTWRWIATYSGDRNNKSTATACNDAGEDVVVNPPTAPPPATPALTTTATPSGPAGSPIRDTAHLSGGANPTGTITFYVFGPNNSNCTGAPATAPSQVQVSGAGDYTSAPFTPTDPGTFHWIAHYSGDANNEPAATLCNEMGETSEVSKANPSITTSAAPSVAYGAALGDTAVLSGGADPRGTITWRLYGPDDDSCSGAPAFVVVQQVTGNGSYPSPTPTPTLAGSYRWVAEYSGDARNVGVSTHCNDPGETVVVRAAPPIPPEHEEPEQEVSPERQRPQRPPHFTG